MLKEVLIFVATWVSYGLFIEYFSNCNLSGLDAIIFVVLSPIVIFLVSGLSIKTISNFFDELANLKKLPFL